MKKYKYSLMAAGQFALGYFVCFSMEWLVDSFAIRLAIMFVAMLYILFAASYLAIVERQLEERAERVVSRLAGDGRDGEYRPG